MKNFLLAVSFSTVTAVAWADQVAAVELPEPADSTLTQPASGSTKEAPAFEVSADVVESAKPKTSVYAGLTSYQEAYKEFEAGNKLMQEVAPMNGVVLGVVKELQSGGVVRAELTAALGEAKYTGSYWGGQYGDLVITGLSRRMVSVLGEYSHAVPQGYGVVACVGLGYRHLMDHLEEGPGGYTRANNRLFVTAGLAREFKLNDKWALTPRAVYKHILYSAQYSALRGGVTVEQQGRGAEYALDLTYRAGSRVLTVSPFVRAWNVKASNVVSGLYEPKNTTSEVGLTLSVSF